MMRNGAGVESQTLKGTVLRRWLKDENDALNAYIIYPTNKYT